MSTAQIARFRLGIGTQPRIASRVFDPRQIRSVEEAKNAKRVAEFHARWRGVKEPLLQLWSVS